MPNFFQIHWFISQLLKYAACEADYQRSHYFEICLLGPNETWRVMLCKHDSDLQLMIKPEMLMNEFLLITIAVNREVHSEFVFYESEKLRNERFQNFDLLEFAKNLTQGRILSLHCEAEPVISQVNAAG